VVLAAGQASSPAALEALEQLCRAYWYPLYAFVRRQGQSPEDAQDLTQKFFAHLLEKHGLATVDPGRGKFRWFLLGALRHFLANERDRANAQKRGGGRPILSLDEMAAERRYREEPAHAETAEKLYERSWALTVLERARDRLRAEFEASGKGQRFRVVEGFLPGEPSGLTFAEAGQQLGVTESAVKSELYRLKKRYREFLIEEIAQTVSSPAEIDEEVHYLIQVVSG
jgi:RNA polymerase sigma factor (sigma-70 family)